MEMIVGLFSVAGCILKYTFLTSAAVGTLACLTKPDEAALDAILKRDFKNKIRQEEKGGVPISILNIAARLFPVTSLPTKRSAILWW